MAGNVFGVRIHGRGGQGVVTAAELLSKAAFEEGQHAQAFPSFGSERTGAPVVAFCRMSDAEIRVREPVMAPDAILVQDATLLNQVNVFDGLTDNGYVVINSGRSFTELGLDEIQTLARSGRLLTIPATDIAREHLGRPVPNVVMLAGFAALTGLIGLASLSNAITEHFPGKVGQRNVAAAEATFERVNSAAVATTAR